MAWLHTWAGLLVGWVLYFVFLTGSAGYLDTEIDRWMRPALTVTSQEQGTSVASAQRRLEAVAAGAERWFIGMPEHRNYPALYVFWEHRTPESGRGERENELLDAASGEPVAARATGGGQSLYRMHYSLHYMPRLAGEIIVGLCSMFMLVAIVTGVIVHKKIFRDFFTFRPGKGQRSWLDIHNLLSVLALPFHLMITYSGLVFYMLTYMPLIVAGTYGGDDARQRFADDLFQRSPATARAGQPAPLVSLEELATVARDRWGEGQIRYLSVHAPETDGARVEIARTPQGPLSNRDKLVFDGVSGALLEERSAGEGGARNVRDTLIGLHEGLFAGPLLRFLYLFSGLAGTAMIATGLVLWSVKRRQNRLRSGADARWGHRLVDGLNLGTVIGLPVAIAAYFYANRLLPAGLDGRDAWELHCLFVVWGLLFVHGLWRGSGRGWEEQLLLAALAFAALPLVNAVTTERGFITSLMAGDWLFVVFDAVAVAVAAVCLWCRAALRRRFANTAVAAVALQSGEAVR